MRHDLLPLAALVFLLSEGSITPSRIRAPSPPAADDQAALRSLTEQLFGAFARADLEGFVRLWSPSSVQLAQRKAAWPELFAGHEQIQVDGPLFQETTIEGDRALVRFEVETRAIELLSKEPARGRSWGRGVHVLRAVREGRAWRVWREGPVGEDLALSLVEAADSQSRAQLLAQNPEGLNAELTEWLYFLGAVKAWEDNNPEALRIYELGRELAEGLGAAHAQARIALGMGIVRRDQGDFEPAFEDLRRSLALFEGIEDKEGLSEAYWASASTRSLQGDYTGALEDAEKSLVLIDATSDPDHKRLGTLMELGQDYEALGELDRALAAYLQILPVFQKLQRKMGIAYTLANIGHVYHERGDYAAALASYLEALSLLEAIGDRSGTASALVDIGLVHQAMGNHDLALSFFERARTISEEVGAKADRARTLTMVGDAHRALGHDDEARTLYEKGRALSEGFEDRRGTATAWLKMGRLDQGQGRYEPALACYERSLELGEAMKSKPLVAESLVGKAFVLLARRDFEGAAQAARRAAAIARDLGAPEALWQALTTAGEAEAALGRGEPARTAFEEAIAAVEAMRLRVAGAEPEQERFFEDKLAPYYGLIRLLVSQHNDAEALGLAERTKGRVLADVQSRGRLRLTRTLDAAESDDERRRERAIISLNAQIARETQSVRRDPARIERLQSGLAQARREYEASRAQLYLRHPDLLVRRGEGRPLSLAEAGELVGRDGVALEYVVSEEDSFLFVLTGGDPPRLRVQALGFGRKELTARVQGFRERLARRDLAYAETARLLYQAMVGPAASELRGRSTLVIIPDGPLWELPFQALQSPEGRALLEEHPLSYAPSLTVLRAMRQARTSPPRGGATLLAFGNPAGAPRSTPPAPATLQGEALVSVPDTEQQVRAIGRLYGPSHSRVYVGKEAREDRVKSEAGRYRILHFATHGLLDDASPLYSQLVLSVPEGNGAEDGRLEAREILDLDLEADLVVLSACETGRGRVGAGEGVIGLTWAFFVAGCPSTVVSQWKVESASTTVLMLEFHRQLQAGQPKARALQQAASRLARLPQYGHPFYWAPFVVVGDGR